MALSGLEGFIVEAAHDGREGVAKAVESLPALIIADLAMPIMDGWETIRRLRSDDRTRHIPIIACSGQYLPHEHPESSAEVLLPKPCLADELLLEVRSLLRRAARRRPFTASAASDDAEIPAVPDEGARVEAAETIARVRPWSHPAGPPIGAMGPTSNGGPGPVP
jgi:CheY-like chemotaxis protein